jgi:hypothetical protein
MNADAAYWTVSDINAVPRMTGAASVLDASDMADVCGRLALWLPLIDVLDVGCGTGRLAKLCDGYLGVDIAPSAVAYCQREGLNAALITGPEDLPPGRRGLIACLSVFTHIDRAARRAYLAAFAQRSWWLLVDVIHGAEGGTVQLWQADRDWFLADLASAGYDVVASTGGVGISDRHTYYSARARE